ncbi:sugar phosphate nucleotidyltransferase [Candidatus Nitrosopelagicus sp.]|nr:sugar phosphate nucleotidyltransferase [Candidatus Nitrosopelagicus sp.]
MRIVFDLDGVICELKKPSESYSEVIPKKKVIQKMRNLKAEGHYLIIHTGRHMRTCDGDVAKVIEKIGKITEDWLEKWEVPYDELVFGKPYADIYIDDLGIEFSSNDKLGEKLESMQPVIIIPMAGEGKRFKNEGIKKPKFMVEVKNKTLFEWSLAGLPTDISKKIIFICLDEHEKEFKVGKFIKNIMEKKYPKLKYELVYINEITGGQVETVLHAKHLIRPESSIMIFNIDTHFISSRLKSKVLTMKNRNVDGLLGCFESDDDNLSFIKLNKIGFVEEVKEKEVISEYASTGLYIFTNAKEFFEAGKQMIGNKNKVKNEYYVSEIYNILLKSGKKFEIDMAEEFFPLGTPDDLKKFEI